MVASQNYGDWAAFRAVNTDSDEAFLNAAAVRTSRKTSGRRQTTSGEDSAALSSSNHWMSAPIVTGAKPLAAPGNRSLQKKSLSPNKGYSEVSREDHSSWSTKLAGLEDLPKRREHSYSRTASTSTSGFSSGDGDKEPRQSRSTKTTRDDKRIALESTAAAAAWKPAAITRSSSTSNGQVTSVRVPPRCNTPGGPSSGPSSKFRSAHRSPSLQETSVVMSQVQRIQGEPSTKSYPPLTRSTRPTSNSTQTKNLSSATDVGTPMSQRLILPVTSARDQASSSGGDVEMVLRCGSVPAAPNKTSQSTTRSSSRGRDNDQKAVNEVRSSSRGRTQTKSAASDSRESSMSRSGPVAATPNSRSSSRSRRSSSSTPADRPVRSSRPPRTSENSRTARIRSRTASLTRVSNDDPQLYGVSSPLAQSRRLPPCTNRSRQQQQPMRGRAATRGPQRTRTLSASDADSSRLIIKDWKITSDTSGSGQVGRKSHEKLGIMAKLFGNQVYKPIVLAGGKPECKIRPRILLAATVYHNTATSLWVATINTNQRGVVKNPAKANKFLKAFSFSTENEARESAIANAPPKMVPFSESPVCFICEESFAVFRRAVHCRNCGVCVCNGCSTTWYSKMVPATYNLKNEANIKICRSCSTLSSSFKKALLNGNLEDAIAIYGTGNINLRNPFALSSKKDELMHPVHCAAEGGNLNILRWLIDVHFCPIQIHLTGDSSSTRNLRGVSDSPILTSKGRSVLSIAMENLSVDMMRYLVVECSLSIHMCKDLKAALCALEAALTALPKAKNSQSATFPAYLSTNAMRWDQASLDDDAISSSASSLEEEKGDQPNHQERMSKPDNRRRKSNTSSSNGDSCIICFDREIDCVATPCGHQMCCLQCSTSLAQCPVCNVPGKFIKIFRT